MLKSANAVNGKFIVFSTLRGWCFGREMRKKSLAESPNSTNAPVEFIELFNLNLF